VFTATNTNPIVELLKTRGWTPAQFAYRYALRLEAVEELIGGVARNVPLPLTLALCCEGLDGIAIASEYRTNRL
jgi:hypothetical protein